MDVWILRPTKVQAEYRCCVGEKSSDNFYVKYILDVITTDTGGQLLNKVQIISRAKLYLFYPM